MGEEGDRQPERDRKKDRWEGKKNKGEAKNEGELLRYIYESRSLGKNQEGGILPDNPGEIIGTVDPGLMDFNAPLFSAEFQRRRLRVQTLFVMRQLLFEVHCKEQEREEDKRNE